MSLQADSGRKSPRFAVLGLLVAVVAALGVTTVPVAAYAASVGSIYDLQTALASGTDGTITLTADAYDVSKDIVVNRDVTIDLGGHALMPNSLTVAPGKTLTFIAGTGLYAEYLQVDGTLNLAENLTLRPYATLTVGMTGAIRADSDAWVIGGSQNLVNNGTITAQVAPDVVGYMTGNNYDVRFINNSPSGGFTDVRVLAPSFDTAGIAFPPPTRPNAVISSWTTGQDGSGVTLAPTTLLDGFPSWTLAYAQWRADGITSFDISYSGAPEAAQAGDIYLTATDTTPGNAGGDITDLVDFTSDNAADTAEAWELERWLYAKLAGPRVISGFLRDDPTVSSSLDLIVTHAHSVAEVELTMAPSTVYVGDASQSYVSASDWFGNSFGANLIGSDICDGCNPVLTSSNAEDVIDQNTGKIIFASTGERTITVTVKAVESDPMVATATVNVIPVPIVDPKPPVPPTPQTPPAPSDPLAKTGASASPSTSPLPAAVLMLLLGASAVILGARRHREG